MSRILNNITVIIPTYTNNEGFKRLIDFLKTTDYSIIVVDNQPSAQKKHLTKHQNITYLPQKENLGFSKAINLAVRFAVGEWLVILNDDIEFNDKNIFYRMLRYAIKNKLCAVSPILKKPTGEIENLGYRVLPIGRVELNFDKAKDIDGLTAACLLINKSIFEKLKGFDERFFAYLEDVDLFLRIKKAGEKFAVMYSEEVIHHHGVTSSKMGNFKQRQDLKNWIIIIYNTWDRKTLFIYFPQIVLERLRNLSGYIKSLI